MLQRTSPLDLDSLLQDLPAKLQPLARRGMLKRYGKGVLLIEEGALGDSLYVLLSGRVKAYSSDESGREIVYGVFGPGDYVGEIGLDGGPRSASVITLEPCTCAVVTRSALEAHIAENPAFAFELLSLVIARARLTTARAKEMALLDVYGRIAHLLKSSAVPAADGTAALAERLTHAEMAARVGCSREMVTRILGDLRTGGYVETRDGLLTLLKPLPSHW